VHDHVYLYLQLVQNSRQNDRQRIGYIQAVTKLTNMYSVNAADYCNAL